MIVCKLFLFYMFYSFLGWVVEVITFFIAKGKFVNRGFLIGPYCPIYGKSVLLITLLLNKLVNKPLILFLVSMLICTIVEYLGSYFLEKIFKTRWWDYSNKKFNINGRVCLENMLLFGVGSMIVMYFINPLFKTLIDHTPNVILIILSIIILIIYILDNIISGKIIFHFSNTAKKVNNTREDDTEDVTEYVKKEITKNNKKLYNRLIKSFPKLEVIVRKKKKHEKSNKN